MIHYSEPLSWEGKRDIDGSSFQVRDLDLNVIQVGHDGKINTRTEAKYLKNQHHFVQWATKQENIFKKIIGAEKLGLKTSIPLYICSSL